MGTWRTDGKFRNVVRRLPLKIKRPMRRLADFAFVFRKQIHQIVRAKLIEYPTDKLVAGRDNVVLVVHEATRTGAPILAWNLVRELQEKYNVIVILKKGGPLLRAFKTAAAAVIYSPDEIRHWTFEAASIVSAIVKIYAPKYAIANTVESRDLAHEFEAVRVPVVALVHEFSIAYRPVGILHGLFHSTSQLVFPARVVADSAIADYAILDGRRFHVLPQGPSKLPFSANDTEAAQSSDEQPPWPGIPRNGFCVVGIGTITMRKGVDIFIDVCAAVKKRLPQHEFIFAWVGTHYAFDQPYFDRVQANVAQSGLGDSFQFLGELDDLDPVYRRADVFLLSSRLDPLPNVAIDSALRGLPVVCFDQASGMAEILSTHNDTRGLVVPPLDIGAAAQLICDLATDRDELNKFSEAIAKIGRQRFDMNRYVERIDQLGRHAARALDQMKLDQRVILQDEAFNPDFNLGHDSGIMSIDEGVLKYLRDSQLASPWTKLRAGLFFRRPLPGFNPLIYATDNPDFDEEELEDPLAHFARSGRPDGRWTHRVILPDDTAPKPDRTSAVAVHGHFHYPELLPEFLDRLKRNSATFDLFLTTTDTKKADQIATMIAKSGRTNVAIDLSGNRGRDVAPFLKQLGDNRYSGYDVVGHFHGKRSPHIDKEIGRRWRDFIWEHLIGGQSPIADTILSAFARDPKLGLVFPEDPHLSGWDDNREIAETLAARMQLTEPLAMHFDFPIGTMFWARPAALQPLTRLALRPDDFPAEPLPIDGTLLHALERLVPFAVAAAGFSYATTYVRSSRR